MPMTREGVFDRRAKPPNGIRTAFYRMESHLQQHHFVQAIICLEVAVEEEGVAVVVAATLQ